MKNSSKLRTLMVVLAGLLVAIALVLSIFAGVEMTQSGVAFTYTRVIWGAGEVVASGGGMSLRVQLKWGAIGVSVAGLILMFIGCFAYSIAPRCVKAEKVAKWVGVGCAAVVLVGAILMFFTLNGFAAVCAGETGRALETVTEELKQANGKCTLATLDAVFGIVAALLLCGASFLPAKKK